MSSKYLSPSLSSLLSYLALTLLLMHCKRVSKKSGNPSYPKNQINTFRESAAIAYLEKRSRR
jgi:hypothetical protein